LLTSCLKGCGPRPLVIPKVMTLKTLGDVRTLIAKHLPAHFRDKATWQHVAAELDKAAAGGDPVELSVALRMALSIAHRGEHRQATGAGAQVADLVVLVVVGRSPSEQRMAAERKMFQKRKAVWNNTAINFGGVLLVKNQIHILKGNGNPLFLCPVRTI
jgi:hypothetical protein